MTVRSNRNRYLQHWAVVQEVGVRVMLAASYRSGLCHRPTENSTNQHPAWLTLQGPPTAWNESVNISTHLNVPCPMGWQVVCLVFKGVSSKEDVHPAVYLRASADDAVGRIGGPQG